MTFFQAGTDTGIHITLSGAVVALIADKLWDRFRKNGNGKEMRDLAENAKLQTTLLGQQTEILREMAKDIAVVRALTK